MIKNALMILLVAMTLIVHAPMTSAITDSASTSDSQYYEEKKLLEQKRSTEMRLEYYNKYKAKGYDVSLLTPYLDASKTTETDFWNILKKVQNNHEVPGRREYVAKLQSKWYDISRFTEAIIWDSGKFWEMVKFIEYNTTPTAVATKKEEMKTKIEEKKTEVTKKVEEKKDEVKTKVSQSQNDRLKALMKARIAKLPADTRDATLMRLESTLTKAIASAQAKNAKMLAARYEALLSVVREEMNSVDDETLISSLFQ